MERYLEKAIPEIGPDVSQEEVVLWFQQHPDSTVDMNTVNQAIRERQKFWDEKAKKIQEKYVADKKEAAKGAQEPAGAPFAGKEPDYKKFVNMTPAEREAMIGEGMEKFFREVEGK
jgi:hypothetical protein